MTDLTTISLWAGTAGMFLGMLYFIATGWNVRDSRRKKFYVVTTFIAAIAFVNYLAMATGFGKLPIEVIENILGTEFGSGVPEEIYWPRYTDWILTTPLLLYDIALLAGADRNTISTLVGLDVLMILTGVVATLTFTGGAGLEVEGARILWWGVSTGFLLVLLYFLFSTLTAKANELSADTQRTFKLLRNMIAVLWLVYPVWWIIGTEGLGAIGIGPETAGFAVLDVTAKVIFGIILLRSHDVLDEGAPSAS
ncbi:rhodopsin [Halorhabdus utahensis DSM 12940]|uniref:Rhodopsin n=1 Tax=Halorhabdus utahensis (strain DSM 12940 / JCM 11049 / AX-2) TaxID=519442 RepID=C7NQP3_HALUD|nr:bacteriorhodopsin [Halorhabdus utahensis]ACV10502.1 rhodopsin [Halorhabdus utahensis DSM 12940]